MNYIKPLIKNITNDFESRDPKAIAEKANLNIKYMPLSKNLKGIVAFDSVAKIKSIIVDSGLNDIMKKYILSHELGHVFLHPGAGKFFIEKHTYQVTDKREKEANEFAAELLIRDKQLNELIKTYRLTSKIAYELGVPESLLKIKLKNNLYFFD